MPTMTIRCESCTHAWKTAGNWSPLVREMIETRPCPKCGAEALCCAEPLVQQGRTGQRRRGESRRVSKPPQS